jgi:integrase/recombinase XerC
MSTNNYQQHLYRENTLKLRQLIKELPSFCHDFFIAMEPLTTIKTRIAYAYDYKIFFEYLMNDGIIQREKVSSIEPEDLDTILPEYIEKYLDHLSYYKTPEGSLERKNNNTGKARKLAAIRSLFDYLYKRRKIKANVAKLVDMPKIKEKPIIRLEPDEVARLLDVVEKGEGLTDRQKKYHKCTKSRDLALIGLFLGTGIRISECVGLNISDFDFSINGFKVTRKGGNEVVLYFGDEVRNIILQYIKDRKKIQAKPEHEDALFLSMQRTRISPRSVQEIVKKYSKLIAPLKNISPHKLRSTYGTNLYRETGDIYIVADVLGHKDVNTTKRHYAAISDDKRRMAARVIKLRD